jgi:hypothetical protein
VSEKVYVKTVYRDKHREPDISEYDSEEDAQLFINACLQWGIGIDSCEITNTKENKPC